MAAMEITRDVFEEIFGYSDEEEEFEGFPAEDDDSDVDFEGLEPINNEVSEEESEEESDGDGEI